MHLAKQLGCFLCMSMLLMFPEVVTAKARHRHAHAPRHQSHPKKHSRKINPSALIRQLKAISAFNDCVDDGKPGDKAAIAHAFHAAYAAHNDGTLKGSPAKRGTETCLAVMYGLSQYETIEEIAAAYQTHELVPIVSPLIAFADDIPLVRKSARPWVRDYALIVAGDMAKAFPNIPPPLIRIPSAVRSYADQGRIVRSGRSPASCIYKELCSTHTTGSTFDISFNGLLRDQLDWLEQRLTLDMSAGKVLMIKESHGRHFHVFVIPPGEEKKVHDQKPH